MGSMYNPEQIEGSTKSRSGQDQDLGSTETRGLLNHIETDKQQCLTSLDQQQYWIMPGGKITGTL